MKTKAEEYFDNTGIPCDSYLTREIVINMLAGFATQQVNLLSKPAVSKCEGIERRASLIAFIQEKVKNRDMNLFMNASELVDQMLKRNL